MRTLGLLLCSITLFSCGTELTEATQIIVILNAEGAVRARTAELTLSVLSGDDPSVPEIERSVYSETLSAAEGEIEWPWVLAIAPKDDDASRDFEVTATVRDLDGELVASVRAITHFVRGEKRSLLLQLEDDCIGMECPATETCSSGDCQDAHVDPTTLPTFDPDQVMDPVVVGPPTRDAGEDADVMPEPDSGPRPSDGGTDGALPPDDASFSDASVSPGCTLNPNRENEVCPEICPEACNAKDDDCDLRIDEEEADADCDLAHGTGECNRGECRVVDCDEDFNDCDQDAVTGCESYSKTDEANCGSCEQACDFPNMIATCDDGTCEPIGCIEMFDDCDESGDSCETPLNTAEDCGYCGFPCTTLMHATATCALGYCGPDQCIGNYGDCNLAPGDGCEQALDTLEFCGDCAAPCDLAGSLDDCSGGVCVAVSCEVDHDDCDLDTSNGCESLSSAMHCGACNRTCDSSLDHVLDADCGTGSCELTCDVAGGFDDCDADPFTGCESSVRTQERCGGCNTPCAIGNAVASCETGACERVRCEDGFGDCDLDGADCEQTLNVATHCGGCDIDCTATPDKPFCAGGSCTSIACGGAMADCNDDGLDCEINTQTDTAHCGACDNACAFTVATAHASLSCSSGACAAACQTGYEDCNRDYRDGCEAALNTLTNCGACGVGCSIPDATATCASGTCEISACDSDWDDCNNDNTSCETPLNTIADCGACGADCALTNALTSCGGAANAHVCEIASCSQSYYADCDLADATGCEIDTRSSAQNCGACGNDCNDETRVLGAHCTESACVVDACDPGFGDCTATAGCETTLGTTQDCAACNDDCSQLANTATTSCSSMACAIGTCSTGFASCDGLASTGCETSVFSTANCGGCASANANEVCANLPNASATSCADGDCHIDTCASDWVDCDGIVANGCEQQLSVVGPCFPDSNCTKVVQAGRNYFFCRNDVIWPVARSRCQSQLLGDLVRVDAVAENTFLATNLSAPSWIGGTDAVTEGAWRWVENAAQFWMGTAGGGAVNGLFTSWAATEPDSTGNCARIIGAGSWADDSCGTARDFICEVQPDLCPTDPAKTLPGQCGCGNLDTDSDGDGTANCNDGCPNDINKVAPGQCSCGTSDLDTDGDGTANCNDGCPDDPNKLSPGACGCNVGDTDIDRDGTPDCVDPCPYVVGTDAGACAYPYQTSNFDPSAVSFARVPDVVIDCGETIIDTSDRVSFINWCGDEPSPEVHQLSDGREVVVIPLASLFIASERVLRVVGARPVIFAVAGDVLIDGYLDGRAFGSSGGAGSGSGCSAPGGTGGNAPTNMAGSGGGGGGGYGTAGGVGGTGYRLTNPIVGGSAGLAERADGLVPLRGGCSGGFGGYGAQGLPGGAPGAGGGAIQISAAGLLQITSKGGVSASGGGGLGANSAYDGGGGGGSGGAVLLEAAAISLAEGSWATANGGGGGGGAASGGSASNPGTDGFPLNDVRAPGGPATGNGGAGGFGAANQTQGNASGGGAGTSIPLSTGGGSGGGGGGGLGRIHVAGQLDCSIKGNFSPNFTTACP